MCGALGPKSVLSHTRFSESAGRVNLPPGRRWTIAEADAFLPGLERLLDSLRDMIERHRGGWATGADPRIVLGGVVEMLAVDGIVLRDLDRGLIDFPATAPSGRDHWLCWLSGEERVEWWHWPEDGFPGRTRFDDRLPE
jgi:hypothetical protein